MMSDITSRGRELSDQLNPAIGTTQAILRDCSEICRLAKRHHTLQEHSCNGYQTASGHWDESAEQTAERREERIEARITALAEGLPEWEESDGSRGTFSAVFQGDPRGCTVKLTGPRSRYDSWGGDGICVPI